MVLLKSQRCDKNNMSRTREPMALTRRERQIMDALYRLGRGTAGGVLAGRGPPPRHPSRRGPPPRVDGEGAGEIMAAMAAPPRNSTVRTQLRVLEAKGHVKHQEEGLRYVYMPTLPRHAARRSALKHLVETFFDGSTEKAVAALLGGEASRVSDGELERIAALVKNARSDAR